MEPIKHNHPRLSIFGNAWGLMELPLRPSDVTWSLEECLVKLRENGFHGCQAGAEAADVIRSHDLRFVGAGRINLATEADDVVARFADAGAECLTIHLGWGSESDEEVDALVDAVMLASEKHRLRVYPETHRATVFQDCWRTRQAIQRRPGLRFNADFSHYYCGQEMTYQGLEITRQLLQPIIKRTRFIHGRISDAQCMQADFGDPKNAVHLENFSWMWGEIFRQWSDGATVGDTIYFAPELGPPSSGYSICYRDSSGQLIELTDRWSQTVALKELAEKLFSAAQKIV